MKEMFVDRFKKGSWLSRSNSLLSDRSKVVSLLASLTSYLRKGGLRKVKEDLLTLGAYIGDIIQGRYKVHSRSSFSLAVAAVLYVVSPLDIIPDILPLGFLDDITIVTWAMERLDAELKSYREWKKQQEKEP